MKTSRREFINKAGLLAGGFIISLKAPALITKLEGSVKIGLIADLHQDIMHDGEHRLNTFIEAMAKIKPDGIIQLGDFAYPNAKNKSLIDMFNNANRNSLHVIGNHDTDNGHTKQQCLDIWGMTNRYYSSDIRGLRIIVLDCNDAGSPSHKGGYPLYIGAEQFEWLEYQLKKSDKPILIASHQPLAGPYSIDNSKEIQALLSEFKDKIAICVNGHSHIDLLEKIGGVNYFQVNSSSYQWVGGEHKHESYSSEIHEKYPWISYTCPYKDALFTNLIFDPASGTIKIEGRKSEWVGLSPADLGVDWKGEVAYGNEIVPLIRERRLVD